MSDVTRILNSYTPEDPKAAEELLPLVYEELRKLAAIKMASEVPGQTIQATALVHEAWLRISAADNQNYNNRNHFYGAASEVMRRILVDRARRRKAKKHGGEFERVELDSIDIPASGDELILTVHEALDQLARKDSEKAEVVKLRFFVGLSESETASLMNISERTVGRHWSFAKAWLGQFISKKG